MRRAPAVEMECLINLASNKEWRSDRVASHLSSGDRIYGGPCNGRYCIGSLSAAGEATGRERPDRGVHLNWSIKTRSS